VNGVLIAFQIVLIVPLFVGKWRTSLLGLACQGLLMGWIVLHRGEHVTPALAIELVDLVLVRGVAAPLVLYQVLRRQNIPRNNDVIAPNLLSWVIAIALVLLSFRLADTLVPTEGETHIVIAVSTSALLLGLLVLATRTGALSQVVGALRIENAIALLELGVGVHHESIAIRIAQTLIVVLTIGYYRWYLGYLAIEAPDAPAKEGAAL
jgi:hydrogenase-4 component E